MKEAIYTVDAFTDRPFKGNPAGVCVLKGTRDDGWRQDVAREMNLSETAFLEKRPDGSYTLRWFTPAVEVVPAAMPPWQAPTSSGSRASWQRGKRPCSTPAA